MQKTLIIGNLGQDATLKDVNGKQFVTFSIADSMRGKNADGTTVERTQWFECTMKPGNVLPYLKKGQQVAVIGRVYATAYTSRQDGTPQAALKCQVHELNLLGGASQHAAQPAAQPTQAPQAAPTMPAEEDGDLPF